MPSQKNRKPMFGVQVNGLDLINKTMNESKLQADDVGDPKTVEDIQKLVNIFNVLAEKLKRIQR